MQVVSKIPGSDETEDASPDAKSRSLILKASCKAATVSGSLALPPGPLGMLTILPDLLAIWNIQRQLVADIAAVYGKAAILERQQMIYCLFKHAAGQVVRDVAVRVGERFLIREATLKGLQQVLRRIGVSISQRAAGKALSRWLPVIGAVGIGGYAFYDTSQVGKTSMAFFSREIVIEVPEA
ncbi:MAG: EcsC family protein [Acidobacteria bacterium]|uniref:EcsC family protein n=1 Tax=Candidatus Polarisedimenticola svalbardensis TaxID=2886004 RepID=A0A8J6XR73_9BACT|nr:EcsC family protein [Candidatus Polarisedimenticola svalbardensis]